jgi:hypothetical protein
MSEEKIQSLMLLIEIFDGLSVFRRYKIEDIEGIVNELGDKRIRDRWRKIRKDVERIVYYPLGLPKVQTLIKLSTLFKFISPISMIYLIFVIGRLLHPEMLPFPFLTNPIYLLIALLIATMAGFGFMITDYLIRRTIVRHEEADFDRFIHIRGKMKDMAQELIRILIKEVAKYRVVDRKSFVMELYHGDYKGIKPVRIINKHLWIFPRSYKTYIYEI